jgi:hypothetical protein
MDDITAQLLMGFSLETILKNIGEPMSERIGKLREVPEMNIAIWEDGYDWLQNNGTIAQAYLNQVQVAVEKGYSPNEIYHQVMREAGGHRREIAERCRAAANYILVQKGGG